MFAQLLKPAGRFVSGATLVAMAATTLALLPTTDAFAGTVSGANPSVVLNTNPSQQISFVTSDAFSSAVPPQVKLTSASAGGGTATVTADSVAANGSGSTVLATFNFATGFGSAPAGPGGYNIEICQAVNNVCSPTADDTQTNGLTVTAAAPAVLGLSTPVRAQNASTTTPFTIQGANFAMGDTVTFEPQTSGNTGPTLGSLTVTPNQISGTLSGLGTASVGTYDVIVKHVDGTPSDIRSTDQFQVVASLAADANAVSPDNHVGLGAGQNGHPARTLVLHADNTDHAHQFAVSFAPNNSNGLTANITNVAAGTTAGVTDITVSISTSASTTATGNNAATPMTLTDTTTGGHYDQGLNITPAPQITSVNPQVVGQNSSNNVVFTGTFVTPGSTVSFPAATGVSTLGDQTADNSGNLSALVLTAATAPTGKVAFSIVDGDAGATDYTGGSSGNSPLSVVAAPVLTSVSPPSVARGAQGQTLTLNGSGFLSGMTATTTNTGVHFGPVNVPGGASNQATVTVSVDANAPTGPISITLTNSAANGGGKSTSTNALTIDSFGVNAISPSSANNGSGSNAVALTLAGTNIPTTGTTTLQLTRLPDSPSDTTNVPPITVSPSSTPTSSTWKGTANLVGAAAGTYQVQLVNSSSGTGTCACQFTITSAASPTISSVSPTALGQGAATKLTVNGTGFTQGAQVTFSKVNNADVITATGPTVFDSPTQLEVPVQVATNAPTGSKIDVTVTNPGAAPSGGSNTATKSGAITIDAAPAITSFTPASLAQGAATTLTITGTGFDPNSATVSFGTGITQGTGAVTITSTQIKVPVKVDPTAPTSVLVTVKNGSDFGTGSKSITINPGPKITSISPQYVAKDFTGTLTITGSGYHSGATVSFPSGSNVATNGNATISADGTTITVPIKVTRTDAAQVDVTVTNNDDLGSVTLAKGLSVAIAPKDPTNVAAVGNGTSVTVSWTAVPTSDSGGAPITGYTVSVTDPASSGLSDQKTTGTSVTFTGLSSTTDYTFKVVATNAANLSSPGATATTKVPLAGTQLTLARSATHIVAGHQLTLSGSLASGNGDPIGGATIVITARNDAGQTFSQTTTTGADGHWSVSGRPQHNATYTASFAGNSQFSKATSASARTTVAPKVTISAPQVSSSANKLVVSGSVSPNKAGKSVQLTAVNSRGVKKTFTAVLSGSSTYRFKVKLGKGKWTLVVRIGATSGNTAGHSSRKTIKRT